MAKKPSGKRDLVKTKGAAGYAKRTSDGTLEADDVGRSQAGRRTAATKAVTSGYGDQGDQKRNRKAALKAEADPGALKGFEAVPPKPGRRKTTVAKSGYSNLIPRKIKG